MKKLLTVLIFLAGKLAYGQQNTLYYYINYANSNSPLLQDYNDQQLLNTLDSLLIVSANKYQLTGAGSAIYAPIIHGFGYDEVISNGGTYSALVILSKPVFNKNNLGLQFNALRFVSDSIRISRRLAEADIVRAIATQYITAYGNLLLLRFNEEITSVLKKEDVLLNKLTEQSVYRQTDYLTFVVNLRQQEVALQQARLQYKTDLYTLNYLAGINDTAFRLLEEPLMNLQDLVSIDSSLFFQQFKIDSQRLTNEKKLIDYRYKPKVGLYADGGYNSSLTGDYYKHFGGSFGVNLSVPLYDGKQKKLEYQKLAIQQRTRNRYKDFAMNQYRQQVAQLKLQLEETSTLIKQINDQLKYSEGLINVYRKLMQTGDANITDYVLALNSFLTAKNQLTQNIINRMQIINQLNYHNR